MGRPTVVTAASLVGNGQNRIVFYCYFIEKFFQQANVTFRCELARNPKSSPAKRRILHRVLETTNNCFGDPSLVRRIAWGEGPVHAIPEPVGNATDRKGCDGQTVTRRFQANQAEWLWPHARHREQV